MPPARQLRSNSVSLDEYRVQDPPSNTPVYLRRTDDVSKGRTVYRVIFPELLQAALAEDATPMYLLAKWVLEGDQIFVFEEEDVIHVAEDEEDVYIQLGCWLDELLARKA